jgi:hypothetical protein
VADTDRPRGTAAHPPGTLSGADQAAPAGSPGQQGAGGALLRRTRSVLRMRLRLSGRRRQPAANGEPRPAATAGKPADSADLVLARLTALPAVLLVAWLVPGLPLLLAGSFDPAPMLLIFVPLAVALSVSSLRVVPSCRPFPGSARNGRPVAGGIGPSGSGVSPGGVVAPRANTAVTWFGLLGTVAVVAGLAAWQLQERSGSVIVLRGSGAYLQAGYWLAQHGSLPIPQLLAAFGGPHAGLSFASTGFLASGTSVQPAVAPGMPMLVAAGFWSHGLTGAGVVGPILGALAALSFAGLAARLVGPRWAPAGALIFGLSLPQQYVSRSALSETALEIALFGGLCLLADALTRLPAARSEPGAEEAGPGEDNPFTPQSAFRDTVIMEPVADVPGAGRNPWRRIGAASRRLAGWLTPQRALAALGGLALGLGAVISLDALTYLLPVMAFAAVLIIGRRPQAIPFAAGFLAGVAYGAAGVYLLDRPFANSVRVTLAIAGLAAVWLAGLAVMASQLARLSWVRQVIPGMSRKIPLRWLPEFGAVLAVAIMIGFAIRPYVQTVHGPPSALVAALQRQQGIHVDPTRLYFEQTLYWVIWYIGLPTVLLGGFGIALLTRRCLRAMLTWRDPDVIWRAWGLPLAVICAGSAAVLWRPDIAPDQPWASRRLVVLVLPGLIICALWAASRLSGWARARGARPVTAAVVGLCCCAAMLVPTAATTFGVGLSHGGKSGGLRLASQGMALHRTGTGQGAAVDQMCAQIPRRSAVVILDAVTAARFLQVVRGMCGVPTASMAGQPAAAVRGVIGGIQRAGRRPVLLASSARRLAGYGAGSFRVLDLATTADPQELKQPPTTPVPVRYLVWMSALPGTGAAGA